MRFFFTFFITFVFVAALYLSLYRFVDPKGEYGTGAFPQPFANGRVTKQRLLTAYLKDGPVDGLFLGSSRSMVLEPAIAQELTGFRFFNYAVENALAEDYLAIYRFARSKGARPKLVVIGLDVEALHNKLGQDLRLKADPGLRHSLLDPAKELSLIDKAEDSLRLADSALNAQAGLAMAQGVILKVKPKPQADVVQPDGHTEYPLYKEQKAAGTWDLPKRISGLLPAYFGQYHDMTALSIERMGYVRQLVDEATADGAKVILWIPPLHPVMVDAIKTTYYHERLKDTLAFCDELVKKEGVFTRDLSSPDKFGGSIENFRDGAHMDHVNAELVLRTLLSDYRK